MTKSEKDIIIIKKGAEYDKQNEKSYLRGGGTTCVKHIPAPFKSSPTSTGRATCVKHVPVPFKSSPTFINRATCVAHDKNLSTYRLNVLETDNTPTLSRICKFAYRSLTNSTLSQRERVNFGYTLAEVFSPCRKAKLNFGFTLAEVLITLGIIGIVAAVTLPTLVSNYRKHVIENQLKTAYTLLAQTISRSEAVNGSFENWDYYELADFDKYIFSHLKIIKNCGRNGRGCFKAIPEKNNIDGWYNIDGTYNPVGGHASNFYFKVLLSNGMSLAVKTSNDHIYRFVIDINGPQKGKSIMGEDIFMFSLYDGKQSIGLPWWVRAKGLMPGVECSYSRTPDKVTMDELLNDANCNGGCNKNAILENGKGPGEACAAVIMKNGWKIPDNYPIKL